jgi:multidrug resistance efflux pump
MKRNICCWKKMILMVLLLAMLTACQGIPLPGAGPSVPAVPTGGSLPTRTASPASERMTAQGKIVPRHSVTLAFAVSGKISEIRAQKGDQVKAGDVLASLGDIEQLEAAVANAELALLTANQAFDDLNKNVDVAKAALLADISTQQAALREAQFNLDNYQVSDEQLKLDPIAAVDVMKERLDAARQAFEPYRFEPQSDVPLTSSSSERARTRQDLKEKLDFAQHEYNSAVKRLEYDFQVKVAQAKLDKDKQDLADMKEGPDPDKLALAQANIKSAEANLKAARANLDNSRLTATIDGVVVDDMGLVVGQQVVPGAPAFQIGDTNQLYIETQDLTEKDIVKISLGQKVSVIAEALPDVTMSGVVDFIPDGYVDKRGDVTYTVKIKLDQVDPRLRWGMTVKVLF